MPTAPATAVVSGVSFSINVTPCNLDTDITIRDFVVLINGSLAANQNNYTKTTATNITYAGPNLTTSTVEVRRNTPRGVLKQQLATTKIRSDDWNREFDRRVRISEEVDLYGAGGGFTIRLPLNDAYGASWATDTLFSPTRQALYNQMQTYISSVSPTLTGTVTVPTYTAGTNDGRVASTAFVANAIQPLAPLASPAFTGVPTVPTAATADNNTTVANTAHVKNVVAPYLLASTAASTYLTTANAASTYLTIASASSTYLTTASALTTYAPLASPALTGVPTAPTVANGVQTNQLVNANALWTRTRPVIILNSTNTPAVSAGVYTDITFNNEISDTSNRHSAGTFTVPFSGLYQVAGAASLLSAGQVSLAIRDASNNVIVHVAQGTGAVGVRLATGSALVELLTGVTYKFSIFSDTATTLLAENTATTRAVNNVAVCFMGSL